jgi:phosphoserine phosphatase
LRGTSVKVLDDVLGAVTLTNGARQLVHAVHEAGGYIIAVSGGFYEIFNPIATQLGLDAWSANGLEAIDGVFTGRTYGPLIDAAAKANFLTAYAKKKRIPLSSTIAVGDGANDLAMMNIAGLSVGFCAKPEVRQAAHVNIDVRDLALVAPYFGRRAS